MEVWGMLRGHFDRVTDQLGAICSVIEEEDRNCSGHFAIKLSYNCHKVYFLKKKTAQESCEASFQWLCEQCKINIVGLGG